MHGPEPEPEPEPEQGGEDDGEEDEDDGSGDDGDEEEPAAAEEEAASAQSRRLAALSAPARAPAMSGFAKRAGCFGCQILEGHSDGVTGCALLPGASRLATVSFDCTIKWWDCATGAELASLGQHKKAIEALALDEGTATLATASRDGNVMLWDGEGMAHRKTTYIGTALTDLCFLPVRCSGVVLRLAAILC